jgi:hypothetical protein
MYFNYNYMYSIECSKIYFLFKTHLSEKKAEKSTNIGV